MIQTLELQPEHDMTVVGSASHLLRVLASLDLSEAPRLREACQRLETSLVGPDWVAMASGLVSDNSLVAAVDMVLAEDEAEADDEHGDDLLGEAVREELKLAMDRVIGERQATIERVAAALAAAHMDGRIVAPIERIARTKLTPDTVLCFPISPEMTQAYIATFKRSLDTLARRIETTMGFRPTMMLIPEGSMPTALDLEGAPPVPAGIRMSVTLAKDKQLRTIFLQSSGEHPSGWVAYGPGEVSEDLLDSARELVNAGHGVRL
tara:strand:+ start:1292 stop:2083 length:792 start_codon:yes stop_codon:yes gene_type:complete